MSLRVVVDSCVALKWVIEEPDSGHAELLLSPDITVIAPELVLIEIANGLWKNERLGRISTKAARNGLLEAPSLFNELLSAGPLLGDCAELARVIDHPVYDCLYVAAARKLGVNLITTDAKLLAKLKAKKDRTAVDLAKWKP